MSTNETNQQNTKIRRLRRGTAHWIDYQIGMICQAGIPDLPPAAFLHDPQKEGEDQLQYDLIGLAAICDLELSPEDYEKLLQMIPQLYQCSISFLLYPGNWSSRPSDIFMNKNHQFFFLQIPEADPQPTVEWARDMALTILQHGIFHQAEDSTILELYHAYQKVLQIRNSKELDLLSFPAFAAHPDHSIEVEKNISETIPDHLMDSQPQTNDLRLSLWNELHEPDDEDDEKDYSFFSHLTSKLTGRRKNMADRKDDFWDD